MTDGNNVTYRTDEAGDSEGHVKHEDERTKRSDDEEDDDGEEGKLIAF